MSVHKDLTGADLHEPKGADTATAGKVYVSDGAGSGVWTTASAIVTNTAFTTGDLKPTHKVTADTSWILWSDGTIGDGSSAASIRANADTEDLFALYWDNYSNTLCPIYTSAGAASTRGASAAADYAAHKRLALPTGAGRVLGLAGTGSGLTARTIGTPVGAETVTLAANQIPSLTSVNASQAISVTSIGNLYKVGPSLATASTPGSGAYAFSGTPPTIDTQISTGNNSISVTYTNGSLQAVSIVPPTAFVNVMIKL